MTRMIGWKKHLCLLCAFILLLGSLACSRPTDTIDQSDSCANSQDCDLQTLGELQISTGKTETGFRSAITGSVGPAEVLWSVSGQQTTFRYKPSNRDLGPEVTIDGTPANTAGMSRAAALLYGYDVASHEASAGKAVLPVGQGTAARYTGPNGVDNTAGCDQLHVLDCGVKGSCCDQHDECINENCGGQGGCGNVLLALQAGYTDQPCSPACLQCHGAVVGCFFNDTQPGPSDCCETGNCGQAQVCMIEGVTITDPCKCKAAGIETSATCESECLPPGTPCIADGEPSLRACQCCSGILRILNVDGSGECRKR